MLTARQRLGIRGEGVAGLWLERHGWTVLDRRFRAGHRDLDLVVARPDNAVGMDQRPMDGRLVAFVEVRTRYSDDLGSPAESVQWTKQRQIARAARAWLQLNRRPGDNYRFDVVGVLVQSADAGVAPRVRIQYVPNAFWLPPFG